MARARHSPIDQVLSALHEAITRPDRINQIKASLYNANVFHLIINSAHRSFLEGKLNEIEQARNSRHDLARIENEIDRWNDREFPVHRGHRS